MAQPVAYTGEYPWLVLRLLLSGLQTGGTAGKVAEAAGKGSPSCVIRIRKTGMDAHSTTDAGANAYSARRILLLAIAVISVGKLVAADDQLLALILRGQSDFDRVELAPIPPLTDTTACVQSQAALLPVAAREELPLIHYRKGYCILAGAAISHNSSEFNEAAAEFEKAIEVWPARALAKNKPPEPVSAALPVLASIARLKAGEDAASLERSRSDISAALANPSCSGTVIPVSVCNAVLQVGGYWLGWMALRRDDLEEAAQDWTNASGSGWPAWIAGRKAFSSRDYKQAAARYAEAIEVWKRARQVSAPAMTTRLSPQPEMGLALMELGSAQLLAGNAPKAIESLDTAIKAMPGNPRAYFLRARARELAGQAAASLADYNLASRAAFANAENLGSGEAHLYRGMLLFRRTDFAQAEEEFSSALNFDIPQNLRPDALAWRHLAAVAAGGCGASRELLDRSLASVSPYFPKSEARTMAAGCPATENAARLGAVAGK